MNQVTSSEDVKPSQRTTRYIADVGGWRGELLARLRQLVLAADPDMTEDWKWETPVFAHKGNVLAIGAFQDHVKINFFKGASLADSRGVFNAGLEAKATRAVDIFEGGTIDEEALKDLVRAAVQLNLSGGKLK